MIIMTSETSACGGFFQDQPNTAAINQYFQQLNSQAAVASSNNSSDSGNDTNTSSILGRSNSSSESTRTSVSSNDSSKSDNTTTTQCRQSSNNNNNAGNNNSDGSGGSNLNNNSNNNNNNHQWQNMQQQQSQHHAQQQQQQHINQQHQQQHHAHQQQQQHHHSQQSQQHLHHQTSMNQNHHNISQQQQQQQQHTQLNSQQQQQQHNHHHHSQQNHQHHQQQQQQQHLSSATTSNLNAAATAAITTNPHSIFGSGNFHYKTNNSWSIPSLSCYQRLYSENAHHYQRTFNNNNSISNSNNTSEIANNNVVAQNVANNLACLNNVTNGNNTSNSSNNANSSNNNNNANHTNSSATTTLPFGGGSVTTTVQHVANAVAAAVIANEHQNHLINLKSRFQPSCSGRKSPFLGFICKTNGKSTSNSKEVICPDDKYKEEGDLWNVEAQTAFLGPNLWEKTLPYDADLKYADLDEFLSENNIPDGLPGTHLGHSSSLSHRSDSLSHAAGLSLGLGHITTKRERSPSPSDCISPDTLNPPSPAESTFSFASSGRDFDPRTRAFSDEELKPQPMIKKSRKQFVPDELKDDKYWARRRKNNIAAKRSRDARRQKENQIAMRARYLEKENATLHQEVEQLKQENMDLRARLSKFQDV